ncbi:hypothetical protein, partial [Treponema paraluiscuniculi]|uniref:hypothetical protein n=1 Tax=Treponema paraluiscuniculi TaxID=53435 RepID=UPI002FDBE673
VESSILERVGLALTLQDGTLVPTLTKVATDSGDQFIPYLRDTSLAPQYTNPTGQDRRAHPHTPPAWETR